MMDKKMKDELEKLLKGTHMGIFTFDDLLEKADCKELRDLLREAIALFHRHEEHLIRYLHDLGEETPNEKGMDERFADLMTMVKHLVVNNDREIADEALKAIDMGKKALHDFKERYQVPMVLQKLLQVMGDDYETIYHRLHRIVLTNE